MKLSIFKTFFLVLCIISNMHFAYAQSTASILPPAKTTFVDQNGKPLTSGTVDFYIPSTTTRKTTWQDAAETIANANPVVLDGAGRGLILGSGSYRQVVKDRLGNIIWDQVTSSAGTSSGGGSISTGDGDLVGTIKPWAGMIAPNQYLFTYGQEISRSTYSVLFTAITSAQPVFCTSGSAVLNGLSDTTNFWIGSDVEVSCLGAGHSTILSKTATSVTLNANANVTTNTTATFLPWGRGNGTSTFNLPDFRGVTLAGNNIMGGVSGSQLTTTFFGATDPNSAGALGGSQSKTLLLSNLPPYTPTGTVVTAFVGQQALYAGGSTGAWQTTGITNLNGTFFGNPNGAGGTAVSATVAAGGSGYTVGSQTVTLSGGTCPIPPQFTITGAAGAITNPVLLTAGLCTVIPSNPVSITGGGGTGGTLTLTWSAGAFSTVQPTRTTNYIIKVTPDQNSATASGVTSLGLMIGDIACGSGLSCTGNIVSVSNIPAAQSATLGGVLASSCASSNWFSSLGNGTGVFGCTQPAFTDISGIATLAQGGTNANLIASNGGIFWSNATQAQILAGTATARLPLLSGASATPVWGSYTIPSSVISGGILCFTSTSVSASSVLQTANAIMLGAGAGACPTPLASLGTTTTVLHGAAAGPPTFAAVVSADMNITATNCTNQFVSAISTGGVGSCTTITLASAQFANQGTTTTVLHGNAAGNPSFSSVVSADLNITTSTCTNQFVTAISATGTATCTTDTLASAQHANQGTTTTVLHGNAAGNPSFAAVALGTDISGFGTGVVTAAGTTLSAAGGLTTTIASGSSALGTSAISSAACATVVTVAATNTATTDVVTASFNGDPTAVTGYVPLTSGMLTILVYPTANNVNFKVCNNTAGSITPGAITLNWRVVR